MVAQFLIFGITVSIYWTSVFLAIFFFAASLLHIKAITKNPGWRPYVFPGIITAILLVFSIVAHEASHAVVAGLLGMTITDAGIHGLGAYVTNGIPLNQTAPINEIFIAFAGPAANFLLALLSVPFIYLSRNSLTRGTLRSFAVINIQLGRYNLWPLFILDGSKVLEGALRLVSQNALWLAIAMALVAGVFTYYVINKKKGRRELESLIDMIPDYSPTAAVRMALLEKITDDITIEPDNDAMVVMYAISGQINLSNHSVWSTLDRIMSRYGLHTNEDVHELMAILRKRLNRLSYYP